MTYTDVNYSLFSDEQIRELAKIPARKYKDKAVKILEYLYNKGDQLCNKKEIISLFDESRATADKVIETLVDTLAVSYEIFSTSYLYNITPIGIKMLQILKEEKGEYLNE